MTTQGINVKLKGGGPWGFRLHGGPGTGSPLAVSKIRRKSKAYNNLHVGDLLISVNGILCDQLTYDQVMSIADKSGFEIILEVKRKESNIESIETNANAYQNSIIPQMKTSVKNTLVKEVKETESMVTENNSDTMTQKMNFLNFDTIPETISKLADDFVTCNKEDVTKFPKYRDQKTNTLSDFSSKTVKEVKADGQKFEEMQTEKFHEKINNHETIVTRTSYEEHVESTKSIPPSTSSESAIESSKTKNKSTIANGESISKSIDSQIGSTTSEMMEVYKQEKSEMTTKINGFSSLPSKDSSLISSTILDTVIADVKNLTAQLESELPFATPVTKFESYMELEEQSDSSTSSKKKKMYSSSSFYEEPHAIYPTVEEQFEMAKRIAESLAADTNVKSKGANMFFKRAKRSTKWIHEGPEPSSASTPETAEIVSEYANSISNRRNGQKKVPNLKLVLDPRHPVDLASLRSTGQNISEHNVISPEVCHGLVRDLQSPIGKGSALFAKRKKKSSEWIVDEEKVKSLMKAHERDLSLIKQTVNQSPQTPSFKSPWDTSLYISNTSNLKTVHPEELAETVIAAADVKRTDSVQLDEESKLEPYRSPIIPATPSASYYGIYKARAPKGWSTIHATTGIHSPSIPSQASPQYVEPFPSYSTLLMPPHSKKFNFQNFNTLPRKWKAQY